MKYFSVSEFAERYGISERTARNYCAAGKIEGAFLTGKTWNIPENSPLPSHQKVKRKISPLLAILREQKEMKLKGSIYHRTQIDLTYNSNHIEGSRLTHDQTRYIFETNTIGITDESVNVDDIIETTNHFRCIDLIIDRAEEKLTESLIKELHNILKSGTSDSRKDWFAVGDYKRLPNEVGGMETCSPEDVHRQMKALLKEYNAKKQKTFEDIIDLHQRFEVIHPFQDGNGRVGRLIIFKECLANNFVPFIITDELKSFYYRGLHEWNHIREYLLDTCLTAQDYYKAILDYFKIKYK
ncbi:DNA-binding protein [Bacteroides sp.]|uniref:DNA-binding protein n=1 Tax=Bacteroides sp. TaxID=29523 RepID=UPI00261EBD73|nr:DNA-binding protein [Bacteroides sp.]